jgi:hypothetical protein
MSIQIIDGFQVNTAAPIDNRIVASGSVARNAIPYKYEGLRVFDTSNATAYVYVNGSWRSENSTGISGNGTTNYLTYYTSVNTIGNSLLYQENTSVKTQGNLITINTTDGSVTAVSFIGAGSGITSISGANINNGSVNIGKLINGSTGQVLVSGVSSTAWANPSQLSVGTASVASSVVSGVSLNIAAGSGATPSLSFTGDRDTGIFSPGSNVTAIASSGSEKIRFAATGVSTGFGTPILGMYVGSITFYLNERRVGLGLNPAVVTRLSGSDYAGNPLTTTALGYSATSVSGRITFPTSLPSGSIVVVCSIDSNSPDFSVVCTNKTNSYIELLCSNPNFAALSIPNGVSAIVSFTAYSLG